MPRTDDLTTVLREARELLAKPMRAASWSARQDAAHALGEVDIAIAKLARDELPRGAKLRALFQPAGPIQEVAAASGWEDAYGALAVRFEAALTRAYGEKDGGQE